MASLPFHTPHIVAADLDNTIRLILNVILLANPFCYLLSACGINVGETVRVPASEEQVTTSKQTVETGKITLGKRQVQEMHQVSDTVQREEARIERAYNEHV